ncbi:MAG: putative glycoside hydrolase [Acidimicrobiia bacterium]
MRRTKRRRLFRRSQNPPGETSRAFRLARSLAIIALFAAAALFGYQFLNGTETVVVSVVGNNIPLEGAVVLAGGSEHITGPDGTVELSIRLPAEIEATALGFHRAIKTIDPAAGESTRVALSPIIIHGLVTDPGGKGIPGALVHSGERSVVTDVEGAFELESATTDLVTISRPGYSSVEVPLAAGARSLEAVLEPFLVKGLRISPAAAGDDDRFGPLLAMAENSVINTFIFDTKNEKGAVRYQSSVSGASMRIVYDPAKVLAQAKDAGLYTITRIVSFQDAPRARNNPAIAIKDADGAIWVDAAGQAWLDPTNPDSWEYAIALGVEACQMGFDEIQFDYTRFPTGGGIEEIVYTKPVDEEVRVATISAFLSHAAERIHAEGCVVSADIFAIVMSTSDDQGIGQRVTDLSGATDAISPMIYPSHYASGWRNLDEPNDYPGIVVGDALATGMPKATGGALMRPWLQAFSQSPEQVRESIAAAEAAGLGWMLWSQESVFSPAMLPSI